jgi:Flp pilus assembly protein TadG
MAGFLSCLLKSPKRDTSRRGIVALEFALIAGPLFLMLLGLVELCLMEGAQQLLESAAYNTSRLAKTGYVAPGQTQAQTVNQILVTELSSYGSLINTTKVTMAEADYSSFSTVSGGGGTSGLGSAGAIVAYTVTYPWQVFTPMMCAAFGSACQSTPNGFIVNLTSTIVVKNEPYT